MANLSRFLGYRVCTILVFSTFFFFGASAQKVDNKVIRIDTAGMMRGQKVGEKYIQYLSHNVELSHKGSKMYCDSCSLNEASKTFQAYGNVTIIQSDGSILSADYVYYNGNNRSTKAKGNVVLTDKPNNLWTEDLDYNLDTKVGTYSNGGILQNESTTLWSDRGVYNGKSHWSHFINNVEVQGADYYVTSKELKYNTETKDVIFLKHSEIYKDNSLMITDGGQYNSETEFADFKTPTTVVNDNQTIHANELKYDKDQGFAYAKGAVKITDTSQHIVLLSDEAYYLDEARESIAYGDPLLIRYEPSDSDTLFMLADTLRTFDVMREVNYFLVKDSLGVETTQADTLYDKNFIAWYGVQVFSDSFQAVGDSIYFSQSDSVLRFYKDPLLWSDQRQMKGDTIYAFFNQKENLDSIKLLTKSSILSMADSIPEGMDQLLGTWISAYFDEGQVGKVYVQKNAQAILFISDDDDEYIGIYKSESQSIDARLSDGTLDSVKLYEDIEGEIHPMEGSDYSSFRFEGSSWLAERRPTDKKLFYKRMEDPLRQESYKKLKKKK